MCQRNECLPAEQSTHRSDGQTGMKRGPKLYSLPRRCLLRNQNKTLYQHSLLCHLWAKRMDGDTESQQCRSPGVAQSRCQHRLLGGCPSSHPPGNRSHRPQSLLCQLQGRAGVREHEQRDLSSLLLDPEQVPKLHSLHSCWHLTPRGFSW